MSLKMNVIIVLVGIAVSMSQGAVPHQMNYQGRLLDVDGNPISSNVVMSVGIYTNGTGGSSVYEESIGSVLVQNGIYSFNFGADGPAVRTALTNAQSWLELRVNGSPLAPRQRLFSVPYANLSSKVEGSANWDIAYGWGDHGTNGYLTGYSETDPIYTSSVAATITDAGSGAVISGAERTKLSGIETAADVTDTANVAAAGAVMITNIGTSVQAYDADLDDLADGELSKSKVEDSADWDTAYGWGDHGTNGYLTTFSETDPVYTSSVAATITGSDTSMWHMAAGWGDHGTNGYLTGFVETDPIYTSSVAATITDAGSGAVI
ncbi:MAG: hypothetical protein HQ523_10710, partial [Lentisphaerae bacterium]|nr:hypothetical protein [Lentisphaerota bacterium]